MLTLSFKQESGIRNYFQHFKINVLVNRFLSILNVSVRGSDSSSKVAFKERKHWLVNISTSFTMPLIWPYKSSHFRHHFVCIYEAILTCCTPVFEKSYLVEFMKFLYCKHHRMIITDITLRLCCLSYILRVDFWLYLCRRVHPTQAHKTLWSRAFRSQSSMR